MRSKCRQIKLFFFIKDKYKIEKTRIFDKSVSESQVNQIII